MKCLMLNSPIYREHSDTKEEYLPPLGLGYIATHLNLSGIKTEVVDCVKEHLGIAEVFKLLSQQRPDYVGINIFTQNYDIVKELVEQCPIKAVIIVGGQVVKSIYEQILQWNVTNKLIIVIGEGELILPVLLGNTCSERPIFNRDHRNVYRVNRDSCYYPQNLSAVQLDRSLFKDDMIINHYGKKEAVIITSRGCMYNCSFCGGAHDLNRDVTIRYRSTIDVESEIREIVGMRPSIESIRVLDDLFLRDKTSINNAIELFVKFKDLSWRGMAHALTFVRSLESLPLLKKSGCQELFIGIESGAERIRKKINKSGSSQQVVDVIAAVLETGIDVKGYFIYGFPSETATDAEETYKLATTLRTISNKTKGNFRASVFQFRPYHGTQLYNELIESGCKISTISSNNALNIVNGRSQFNFQSGNYSDIEDSILNEYILKTQALSEMPNV